MRSFTGIERNHHEFDCLFDWICMRVRNIKTTMIPKADGKIKVLVGRKKLIRKVASTDPPRLMNCTIVVALDLSAASEIAATLAFAQTRL